MKLTSCISECANDWIGIYSQEAAEGNTESMIIFSKLLIRGSNSFNADIRQGIYWLKKACKKSPEAAFRLGKLYRKGKYAPRDITKSYFYLKLATLSKCKCGELEEQYHNNLISNVHPCFSNEASKELEKLCLSDHEKSSLDCDFHTWKSTF